MNCPNRRIIKDFPYYICDIDGEVHDCNIDFKCKYLENDTVQKKCSR